MRISCTRLRDMWAEFPPIYQVWLRELAMDDKFNPCLKRQVDRRTGKTHDYFRQVPISECVACKYGYRK